ncbi:Benomyl/methotrexate resistance protein [Meredithblackwellia eburnea MCA 4105]
MTTGSSKANSPAPTLVEDNEAPSTSNTRQDRSPADKTAPGSVEQATEHKTGAGMGGKKVQTEDTGGVGVTGDEEKASEAPQYAGSGTLDDPYVVRWLEGDRANPLNWGKIRKWAYVQAIAWSTLCVAFGSSIYAGGIRQMEVEFHIGSEVITLGLSLYVVGFALGPLLWAPFSEMWGRRRVHIFTYAPFAIFQIGCALARNVETLLICRFLAGTFGSAPLTNAGGVISDMFSAADRALALSMFALAPFAGPVLGPIIGGFVGQNTSWRWIFWIQTIFSGTMYFIAALVPESYAPVLLRRRAAALSSKTQKVYKSEYDLKMPSQTLQEKLVINMSRPFVLLFKESIVSLFALYAAVVYGTLYGMFGAYPVVFQQGRGWSEGIGGLPFIGVGVGMLFAIVLNVWTNNKYVRDLEASPEGRLAPEARLPICAFGGCCLPVGLFWFAWTCQPSVHWIVPILAGVPFGLGMVLVFLSMMNYLVDAYLMYAASALAANAVLRSIFGAVFPLFIVQMFHGLGNNWALTLLAFLSLVLCPIPFLFMKYGARIRGNSKFAPGHAPPKLSKQPSRAEEDLAEEQREADLRLTEERSP